MVLALLLFLGDLIIRLLLILFGPQGCCSSGLAWAFKSLAMTTKLVLEQYLDKEEEKQEARAKMVSCLVPFEDQGDDSDYEELLEFVGEQNLGDPDVKKEQERLKTKKRKLFQEAALAKKPKAKAKAKAKAKTKDKNKAAKPKLRRKEWKRRMKEKLAEAEPLQAAVPVPGQLLKATGFPSSLLSLCLWPAGAEVPDSGPEGLMPVQDLEALLGPEPASSSKVPWLGCLNFYLKASPIRSGCK